MRNELLQKFNKNAKLNLDMQALTDLTLKTEKSYLTKSGAVATFTGERTSRSPDDRFFVVDENTKKNVSWGGYNHPIKRQVFDAIFNEVVGYLSQKDVYVVDCVAGQDDSERMDMTVFTELPSQAMFVKIMFRDVVKHNITDFNSQYTILSAPELRLDKKKYGINSYAFIGIDFTRKLIVVVGTGYVCEIKKGMFSVFNYEKPAKHVLTMHCSANSDKSGKNSAIFFGLSGTGKTTLSTNPGRFVVGDDQNGWNNNGLFNIEDGCYAKIFELDAKHDPDIYQAIRDGALLENVVQDKNGDPDFFNSSITENMRTAYPLTNLKNVIVSGKAEGPKNIFFLTADSTGVFPPIAKLNSDQIKYYFLNGFTSKMTGLEGDTKEPEWTFSACFGAPFMPRDFQVYANLLEKKVRESGCNVWLVNTGWTGGKYGVGTRIKLSDTRRLVDEATTTGFANVPFEMDGYLGLSIPTHCDGISDDKILNPSKTWANLKDYEKMVKSVQKAFKKNSKQLKIK